MHIVEYTKETLKKHTIKVINDVFLEMGPIYLYDNDV
jgi:hypothetical protein